MIASLSRLHCFDVARDLHAMLCAAVRESEDRGGNVSGEWPKPLLQIEPRLVTTIVRWIESLTRKRV